MIFDFILKVGLKNERVQTTFIGRFFRIFSLLIVLIQPNVIGLVN